MEMKFFQVREEKKDLWIENAANGTTQVSIGKQWKEFLDYNDTIDFIFHDDAKKLDRVAKNSVVEIGLHYADTETLLEFPHYIGLWRQYTMEYWMLASLLYQENETKQQSDGSEKVTRAGEWGRCRRDKIGYPVGLKYLGGLLVL
ncbi:hypothetical protein MTR67_035033 [Solanum verrucosum]|uniref:Uncharacterized protein n=1 Tax=Solanum verrucosum TaxID=315347 RepID=A0AAF0U8T4_SOLVR|nr:hypothetical protein MTR67_035033 [Solanum verrucosum]